MNSKLTVKHVNANNKQNTEVFNTTLSTDISSETAIAVDTWARQFVYLTTDTYNDSTITSTLSINEKIAESGD